MDVLSLHAHKLEFVRSNLFCTCLFLAKESTTDGNFGQANVGEICQNRFRARVSQSLNVKFNSTAQRRLRFLG